MTIACFVDDLTVDHKECPKAMDELIVMLHKCRFTLECEGDLASFLGLGIKHTKNQDVSILAMTQAGLIKKILATTQMEDCNPNWVPAPSKALGVDLEGEPFDKEWSYPSVVACSCTSSLTPVVMFCSQQVKSLDSITTQRSHGTIIKTVIRHLKHTKDKGVIIQPDSVMNLNMFVDASFGGQFGRNPDRDLSSAKSEQCTLLIACLTCTSFMHMQDWQW